MPERPFSRPSGLLIDLDGTVYEDDRPLPGAVEAIGALRTAGMPFRFLTNTTRMPRRAIVDRLEGVGIAASLDDVFTAPLAAAAWLGARGLTRVALCLPEHTHEDFTGFTIVERDPQAVVVGDLGPAWTFDRLNQAFEWLHQGALLVALHRNRYWKTGGRLTLDAGGYVAALEYAAGVEAVVVGKPSPAMFEGAARSMGLAVGAVAAIGDDITVDVAGAQAAGARGVLVRTGKGCLARDSAIVPDRVLASIADVGLLLA